MRKQEIIPFPVKARVLPGSSYDDLRKNAVKIINNLKGKSGKKNPFVRSAYFKKDKVFFDLFWKHIFDKGRKIRTQRLKLLLMSIELIKNSHNQPEIKTNPNRKRENLYRFYGVNKTGYKFVVQIKEDIKLRKKFFISVYPYKK